MFTWNLAVVESDKQGATDKLANLYSSPSTLVIAGKRSKTGKTVACGQF